MEEESRRSRVWRRRAGDREYGRGEQEIESMEESRRSRVWDRGEAEVGGKDERRRGEEGGADLRGGEGVRKSGIEEERRCGFSNCKSRPHCFIIIHEKSLH